MPMMFCGDCGHFFTAELRLAYSNGHVGRDSMIKGPSWEEAEQNTDRSCHRWSRKRDTSVVRGSQYAAKVCRLDYESFGLTIHEEVVPG